MNRPASETDIRQATALLKQGGVVAFPTETVYGLGADAANPEAVRRIFSIKGRPSDHPLIIHIATAAEIDRWASEVPLNARRLAARYWPGPLTLILRRGDAPFEVTGGQETVGLRAPAHPVAQALLHAFGSGIAAPSANRFGRVSPTTANHVHQELGSAVDLILEGGICSVGLESTILSLVDDRPILLRPGAISRSQLEADLGCPVERHRPDSGLRASGLLDSHYAPETRLELCSTEGLHSRVDLLLEHGVRVVAMTITAQPQLPAREGFQRRAMAPDTERYGQRLYATLRELDEAGFDRIVVEMPPAEEGWAAVRDRLRRAAYGADREGV